MELINHYFPDLTERQREQFGQLGELYQHWNERVNVISRKDIDQLYAHHVLHSLAIARVVRLVPGARVLDLGTGGGFPGIPLAILFPTTQFMLVDGTGKKISVVKEIAAATGLDNVEARHQRVEELKRVRFDFVVSRAVAPLPQLVEWSFSRIRTEQQHAIPNGLLALKGGNVAAEVRTLPRGSYTETFPIQDYFDLPYYAEKYVVYVQF